MAARRTAKPARKARKPKPNGGSKPKRRGSTSAYATRTWGERVASSLDRAVDVIDAIQDLHEQLGRAADLRVLAPMLDAARGAVESARSSFGYMKERMPSRFIPVEKEGQADA